MPLAFTQEDFLVEIKRSPETNYFVFYLPYLTIILGYHKTSVTHHILLGSFAEPFSQYFALNLWLKGMENDS